MAELKQGKIVNIACDVDGIVAPLLPEVLRRYNEDWEDTVTLERAQAKWDFHDVVRPECGAKVYEYFSDPDLYENMVPIAGAVEGIHRLRELGHSVTFVTSCYYGMVDQKARFLERHGLCKALNSGLLPDDLIVAHQKHLITARLLIEDAPHTVRKWITETNRRAVILDYPYNAPALLDLPPLFAPYCFRASTWADITEHVEHFGRWQNSERFA